MTQPTTPPTPTIRKLVTIGAYGYEAEAFFQALQSAQVDTFVDIRMRRGVRGAQYAFANSQRLQARLAELGIRYIYLQDLAPTAAVRDVQHQADAATKTAKRARATLSPSFIAAYQSQILNNFPVPDFLAALPEDAQVVSLFCVEKDPAACHRSLVADRLQAALAVPLVNLLPLPTSTPDP